MKKTVLFALLYSASISFRAQVAVISDFSDLTLSSNSFWNGSDQSGGFNSGIATYGNYYDTTYMYWTGYAYSNQIDIVTPGIPNEYSAYTTDPGTSNFGIWYNGGLVSFDSPQNLASVVITNTTFAALSMRDGDAYGKQFGSLNNANGTPDGTNGEDFLRLKITALNVDTLEIDSVIFYLADYRFTDPTLDYIINDWEVVDLGALTNVSFLSFELTSSDNGDYGMNTPSYFAFDDLLSNTAGITDKSAKLEIYPNPSTEFLSFSEEVLSYRILDLSGKILMEQNLPVKQINVLGLQKGMYIIQGTNAQGSFVTDFVKN